MRLNQQPKPSEPAPPTLAAWEAWLRRYWRLCLDAVTAEALAAAAREHVEIITAPVRDRLHLCDEQTGERITSHQMSWCASDEAARAYYAACDEVYAADGWKGEPGTCPALVAEWVRTRVETALLRAACEVMPGLELAEARLEHRAHAIDLLKRAGLSFVDQMRPDGATLDEATKAASMQRVTGYEPKSGPYPHDGATVQP